MAWDLDLNSHQRKSYKIGFEMANEAQETVVEKRESQVDVTQVDKSQHQEFQVHENIENQAQDMKEQVVWIEKEMRPFLNVELDKISSRDLCTNVNFQL